MVSSHVEARSNGAARRTLFGPYYARSGLGTEPFRAVTIGRPVGHELAHSGNGNDSSMSKARVTTRV
jgi:hypothetical protein